MGVSVVVVPLLLIDSGLYRHRAVLKIVGIRLIGVPQPLPDLVLWGLPQKTVILMSFLFGVLINVILYSTKVSCLLLNMLR